MGLRPTPRGLKMGTLYTRAGQAGCCPQWYFFYHKRAEMRIFIAEGRARVPKQETFYKEWKVG
jgi:hypothetical protein